MLTSKNINQLIMKYQLKTVYINYKLMRRELPKLHKTKTYQSEKLILLELEKRIGCQSVRYCILEGLMGYYRSKTKFLY